MRQINAQSAGRATFACRRRAEGLSQVAARLIETHLVAVNEGIAGLTTIPEDMAAAAEELRTRRLVGPVELAVVLPTFTWQADARTTGMSPAGLERMLALRKTVSGADWERFTTEGNVGPAKR